MATIKRRGRRKKSSTGEALNHVISLRISDQELQQLKQLTRSSAKSVSTVLREAMTQRLASREELVPTMLRAMPSVRAELPLAQAS